METKITNEVLGEYFGMSEGAIRALKKKNPVKFNALRNSYLDQIENDMLSDEPFVIMLLMFKGGIGKSALARIVNNNLSKHKSIILNLDISRDVKKYTSSEAINFADIQEEEADIEADEFIRELKLITDYIVIDTPGELSSPETHAAIKEVDLFILPYGTDEEEKDLLFTTMSSIFFSDAGLYPVDRELNMLFVLNKYREDKDLVDASDIIAEIEEEIREEGDSYPKVNISFSDLKYSKAIQTMNRTKKSITELSTENFAAYRMVNKRIKSFMKTVKKSIEKAKKGS